MKHLRARVLVLCGLMVLIAAALAPIVAQADYGPGCPDIIISCGNGSSHSCGGRRDGQYCYYDANCLHC